MPQATSHLIEQFARTHERDVKRTLQRHYGAKLSSEDISDVLQDTYVAASTAVGGDGGPNDPAALRMWFYGAVRHKAIDAIRGVEGRRYTRGRDASYDALAERGAAPDAAGSAIGARPRLARLPPRRLPRVPGLLRQARAGPAAVPAAGDAGPDRPARQ